MNDHKITYTPQEHRKGKSNVGAYIPTELKEILIARAKKDRRSQAFIIQMALEAYLETEKLCS